VFTPAVTGSYFVEVFGYLSSANSYQVSVQ
jgi:hypothetical protein